MTSISGCSRGERANGVGAQRLGAVQHAQAGGIEDPHLAAQAGDEQAGGQARDDLAAQALGGVGARRGRALLRLQLGHRFLQRRREQRGFGAAAAHCAPRAAAAAEKRSSANASTPTRPATSAVRPSSV